MEQYIHSQNGKIYTRVAGQGPPILLVHGVGSDADYFQDSLAILSKTSKGITYDRNGYSRSTPLPGADFGICAEARDLLAVYDLAGDEKVTVVGVSGGSTIALEAALLVPDRTERLILYEPAFCFTEDSMRRMDDSTEKIDNMAVEGRTAAALLHFVDLIGGIDPDSPPVSVEKQIENFENFKFYLEHQLKIQPSGTGLIDKLKQLRVPCHIMAGTRDQDGLFCQTAKETAQLLGVSPILVDGYHNYPKDHPTDFARDILHIQCLQKSGDLYNNPIGYVGTKPIEIRLKEEYR